MKKSILMAAALMVATSAQAVILNWAGNGATSRIFGLTNGEYLTTGIGSETAGMTVYYLLVSDLATVQSYTDVSGEANVASLAQATAVGLTSTATSAGGRFGGSSTIAGSDAGESYFARIYATFEGMDYYMDLQYQNSSYWTTTISGPDSSSETLGWGTATYGGSTGTAGTFNTWVPVPEPATGALALAGAALLLRRRRRA